MKVILTLNEFYSALDNFLSSVFENKIFFFKDGILTMKIPETVQEKAVVEYLKEKGMFFEDLKKRKPLVKDLSIDELMGEVVIELEEEKVKTRKVD